MTDVAPFLRARASESRVALYVPRAPPTHELSDSALRISNKRAVALGSASARMFGTLRKEVVASPFDTLDNFSLVHTLSFLTLDERMRAAAVSRRLRSMCAAQNLWELVSFDGVSRPLSYDGLGSICCLAGSALRTLDLRGVSRIKAALFPASLPPHVEAMSMQHQVRLASDRALSAIQLRDADDAEIDRVFARFKLLAEGATFAHPRIVRLPFSKDTNPAGDFYRVGRNK